MIEWFMQKKTYWYKCDESNDSLPVNLSRMDWSEYTGLKSYWYYFNFVIVPKEKINVFSNMICEIS